MPRAKLEVPCKLEKLSVLDPDGKVDAKLDPKLPDNDLLKLYKTMWQTRLLDERCLHMQRQGRIGTYGPCKGQEATPLGVAYTLRKDDWYVPSYRELAGCLWRGWKIGRYMLWWGGHEEGSQIEEGVNDTPLAVPIASQCQYAMGIAWASKLRGEDTVCAAFCGDGGTSQGDFHEALNFAAVYKAPMVMVVQNNGWAISLPRDKQTAAQSIAQKAVAYGIDGIQIDGNDILGVIVAAREAVAKARKGGGPTLIEAITYRMAMHTTADDPKKYRSEEEVKAWEPKDPLTRFRKYLAQTKKILTDKVEKEIETQIREEIDEGVRIYESYELDQYAMFHNMYETPTPELRRQEAELRDYLENGRPDETPTEQSPTASERV
ncbi:MAG: pyruvate dehydrogenase (acetyl-transferring) E1 component subunit alpha [Phycisphaerales bacterium]|nr:pyruvate dehydrogenase (acetyl-transferring) E1 component subunit alpha [Phycisphaerales bacterium]